MSGVAVYGGGGSDRVVLASSVLGIGFLSQSSAKPVGGLSSSHVPSKAIVPSIAEMSEKDRSQSIKVRGVSDAKGDQPRYTQKEVECAEATGTDLSECRQIIRDDSIQNPDQKTDAKDQVFVIFVSMLGMGLGIFLIIVAFFLCAYCFTRFCFCGPDEETTPLNGGNAVSNCIRSPVE